MKITWDTALMHHFSLIFRHLRPDHPKAEVFFADAGIDSDNVTLIARTNQGDKQIVVSRDQYRLADDAIRAGKGEG